jgi:HK97 family phage portal protein
MPTFYQRVQNAIKGFNQDTNPNYNKFIYSTMGNNVISNNQNDDSFISKGYQKNPTIYSIINLITKCASAIPFQVYEKTNETQLSKYKSLTTGLLNKDSLLKADVIKKDALTLTEGTDLEKLLNRPNPAQSYATFITELIAFGKLTGNRYIYGIGPETRESKKFNELYVLPSHLVEIKSNGIFEPVDKYIMSYHTTAFEIESNDVLHIADFNPDYQSDGSHLYGQSPLMAGLRTMTTNNESVETSLKFLQNQTARGILTSDDESLTPTQAQQLKDAFRRNYQGSYNAGDIIITPKKLSWTNFGLSVADLQLIESYNATVKDLCNIFSIPVQLLNNTESSTYNNMKEAKKAFYVNAVIPELVKIRDELNRWLSPAYGDKLYIDFDFNSIPELQQEQEKLVEQLTKSYWLTMNEKRQAMGYGVSDNTVLDDYFIPSNFIPLDDFSMGEENKNFFDAGYYEKQDMSAKLRKALKKKTTEERYKALSDEVYDNPDEAMDRAREIGCSLTHSHSTDDGTVYMPCQDMEELEEALGKINKQDKFAGYPKSAITNAKKAVKINEKYNNSCATAVGKQRAQDIISNRSFSLSILKRVHGYLSRAKAYDTGQYEKDGKVICGTVSYNLWGGDPMLRWSKSQLDKLDD